MPAVPLVQVQHPLHQTDHPVVVGYSNYCHDPDQALRDEVHCGAGSPACPFGLCRTAQRCGVLTTLTSATTHAAAKATNTPSRVQMYQGIE